eukprot:1176177-Prorocentrum_minimum.AAC.1
MPTTEQGAGPPRRRGRTHVAILCGLNHDELVHQAHRRSSQLQPRQTASRHQYNNVTSFYGSSCAVTGKGALNTLEQSPIQRNTTQHNTIRYNPIQKVGCVAVVQRAGQDTGGRLAAVERALTRTYGVRKELVGELHFRVMRWLNKSSDEELAHRLQSLHAVMRIHFSGPIRRKECWIRSIRMGGGATAALKRGSVRSTTLSELVLEKTSDCFIVRVEHARRTANPE